LSSPSSFSQLFQFCYEIGTAFWSQIPLVLLQILCQYFATFFSESACFDFAGGKAQRLSGRESNTSRRFHQ
jgi:hypothetical protein